MNMDIQKHIQEETNLDYLRNLLTYVEMDIANIGKDSPLIRKMKAQMRNLTVEEMEKQQLEGFTQLKEKIETRIQELS